MLRSHTGRRRTQAAARKLRGERMREPARVRHEFLREQRSKAPIRTANGVDRPVDAPLEVQMRR